MKKRVGTAARALLLGVLSATGACVATAAPSAGHACRPRAPITLGIPGIPPAFLGVRPYLADKQGFYSKYCADVTIKPFTTGVYALRAVQTGQIDAAWVPTTAALGAIAKGADLVGIEGMDVVDWEVGSIDPAIRACSDLKGQTIGVDSIGGARYAALQAMLSYCRLTIGDVRTVDFAGAAAMQAQSAGSLTVSVLHIDEEAQIEYLRGRPLTIPVRLTDVDPYQHYDMLVVRKSAVKTRYYDFLKLLAGDIAATRYMSDPRNLSTVAQIGTVTGVTADVARIAVRRYTKIGWWPLADPGLDRARLTRTIGLNVKLGNLAPSSVTWKSAFDTRMWKAAYKLATGKKYTGKPAAAG